MTLIMKTKVKHVKPLDFLRTKLIQYVFKSTVTKSYSCYFHGFLCQYLNFRHINYFFGTNESLDVPFQVILVGPFDWKSMALIKARSCS